MYTRVLTLLRPDDTGIPILCRGSAGCLTERRTASLCWGVPMVWIVLNVLLVAVAVAWARIGWLYAVPRLRTWRDARSSNGQMRQSLERSGGFFFKLLGAAVFVITGLMALSYLVHFTA